MAVTDTQGQAINNTNNTTAYTALAFTPIANDLIVVVGGITDTAATLAVTDTVAGASAYDKLVDLAYGTSHKFGLWVGNALAAATNRTIGISCTGDAGSGCCARIGLIRGGRSTAPFYRQFASNTGAASTTPSVTFANPVNTNNAVLAAVYNLTNPAGITEISGFTEQQDIGHINIDMGEEYCNRMSGETGITLTWGSTSASAWGAFAVEIYEAAQPTPKPFFPREFIYTYEQIQEFIRRGWDERFLKRQLALTAGV